MTEKRYVEELWAYDDIMVKDNESGEELWNNMIYERMNEQDEQIKELKIELRNKTEKWEYELGMKLKYHSKLIDSEKENEQLKSSNMEMEDYIGRLKEEKIKLEIKLDLIRNYAVIGGEVKQELIENIVVDENHDMIIDKLNGLSEENKWLKDFIRKISTNNEIILANGTIYKIDKVIK